MQISCMKFNRSAFYLLLAFITVFLIVNQFAVLPAEAEIDVFSVNYPPDNTAMEYDILSVSLKIDLSSVDMIRVKVNGREQKSIVPDNEYECFSLNLRPGDNKIEIEVIKDKIIIDGAVRNVFHRSDLSKLYMKVPDGFRKDYFHMTDTSKCSECHKMEPVEYDKKPISPKSFAAENLDKEQGFASTSTCYSCHKKITSRKYVHGPAAVWSCLSCHETDLEPRYSVRKPYTATCFECHEEQKNYWDAKKYMHGPVTIGSCTICHSPHSANNPFNLFKKTWDLCTNCHAEKGSGRHVLGDSFSTEGHPTRNRKDPLREGKELSCASCHEPHASNFPHLWAFDVENLFELCKKCHFDK